MVGDFLKQDKMSLLEMAYSLLQLVLGVSKRTVGSSGAAPLLTEVSAHAGLVLAVGLRLEKEKMLDLSPLYDFTNNRLILQSDTLLIM